MAEMAVADEVARILTATLDIAEAYEKFAQEMKKLVVYLRSKNPGTYGPREQAILERISSHIAPAVANAEVHHQLLHLLGKLLVGFGNV